MSDVLITPASSKIEFKDASSNIDGTVKLDSDGNLELTSNNGISFGDTSSDVFIGNGTDNVDLKFEADGSITGTSGVTLTLGSSNSNVKIASNELSINATSGVITATTFSGNLNGTLTVVDESSDTTCFPLFVTNNTGNLAPKAGTNLQFNSSTGRLRSTQFQADGNILAYGNIVGDNSTDISGIDDITANSFTGDLVGIAQSARGISNKPRAGFKSGTTSQMGEGLEEGSQVSIGLTIGLRCDMYYDNSNQRGVLMTGNPVHSNNRNYGSFEMRTNRGINNTTNADSIYPGHGSSLSMSVATGDIGIGLTSGYISLGGGSSSNQYNGTLFDMGESTITNCAHSGSSFNLKLMRRSNGNAIEFVDTVLGDVTIGSITLDTSANTTTYNETSDYRIKENVIGITSALDKINQLRPINFNFIGKSVKLDGFLAHEVQAVVPYAVHGEKDAVKTIKDGDLSDRGTKEDADRIATLPTKEVPDLQQLDKSKLIALLTASVQELSAKNDALEARISALESGGS